MPLYVGVEITKEIEEIADSLNETWQEYIYKAVKNRNEFEKANTAIESFEETVKCKVLKEGK